MPPQQAAGHVLLEAARTLLKSDRPHYLLHLPLQDILLREQIEGPRLEPLRLRAQALRPPEAAGQVLLLVRQVQKL